MEKKIIKFWDIEIEKQKFQQHKRPISIKNIDLTRSLFVKRVLNISLYIKMLNELDLLLNMCTYRKDLDETKYISFLIKNDEL